MTSDFSKVGVLTLLALTCLGHIYLSTMPSESVNWLPGIFFNYTFTSFFTMHLLVFMDVFVVISLLIFITKNDYYSVIATLSIFILALYIGGSPIHSTQKITRMVGVSLGIAKQECWMPKSFECLKSQDKKTDDATPRIWAEQGGMTDWAVKQLEQIKKQHPDNKILQL